jgi:cytochrome c peroxidase
MSLRSAGLAVLVLLAACGGEGGVTPTPTGFVWALPKGFPGAPRVPADNPMTLEKIELGRRLFYDARMSVSGTFSCASCHEQARAFSDGKLLAVGATGAVHPRNSMSLTNSGYGSVLTWANPNERTLEHQALTPMFGESPVELGLVGLEDSLFARLGRDTLYQRLFPAAFGDTGTISLYTITRSLAAFQRSLISGNAPYDRYRYHNEPGAITGAVLRGGALFFSERLECFHCHGGFNFSGSTDYEGKGFTEKEFHNTGLYNIDGQGGYPAPNIGLKAFTGLPQDMGRFKAPTLRNITLTAPYMHDGSIATLDEVLDHYAAGGRTIGSGPSAGIGSANPYKSGFVGGFTLSPSERADVLAFLQSLTDSTFITDTALANPWPAGSPANP